MSRIVHFEVNLRGLNELMKSSEMQDVLREAASSVAGSAGAEYGSDVHTASFVAIGTAFPTSIEGARDNHKNNTLLKALGGTGLRMKGK